MPDSNPRIVIIGAGPTGLGAAHRLHQLGYDNWELFEASSEPGGLSASIRDEKGFTWDLGGHVQFSHYDYFDQLMDELLGQEGWLDHQRESWVWIRKRFVPYPFQFNIRRLPREEMKQCVAGLVRLYKSARTDKPANFGEWVNATFGEGLARIFMRPYNWKVWAYPPEMMSYSWTGDRVAVVDLERVLNNIFDEKDDVSWGPNNTFRFPRFGGTGAVWRECARRLPADRLHFSSEVVGVDAAKRVVSLRDGTSVGYDQLLSSVPLDQLARMTGRPDWESGTRSLSYSSTHIFGFGLTGKPREELATKCWMYFPEDDNPFYRVTLFSNYSPNNVPDISKYWSLMLEVSESPHKQVAPSDALREEVIQGMLNTQLIQSRDQIRDVFQTRVEYGYPTPTLERDAALVQLLPELDRLGISSRGRFGAWKYEVGNQDHSLMQGVEWVDHVLNGAEEITVWHPERVNDMSQRKAGRS